MTAVFTTNDVVDSVRTEPGVYAPQHDSRLLVEHLALSGLAPGARVLDLCTGSGVIALAAAALGAKSVVAYDINIKAVNCARNNAVNLGLEVDARQGSLDDALRDGPYDLVVSNPPYVPSPTAPSGEGIDRAWDAGADGRVVLDPLCSRADELLVDGGSILIVQSEFAGIDRSVDQLAAAGLTASVAGREYIPFGPVTTARASWLRKVGKLEQGSTTEEVAVLRADKPAEPS